MLFPLRPVLFAACIAALTALSGCLVSQKPLITPEQAVFPLSEGVWAHYETPDSGEADAASLEWRGPVRIEDGVYTSTEDDFPYEGARFAQMREGVYIVQHPPDPGDEDGGWMYSLLYRLPDGHYGIDFPNCEDIPQAERGRLGLTLDDGACTVADFDTLVAAAEAFETAAHEERGGFFLAGYFAREGDL